MRRPWRLRRRRPRPPHLAIGVSPGVFRYDWGDPFHFALAIPWRWFMPLLLATVLGINLVFAALYALRPGCIANLPAGSLADAFFFSVQTFATVGYGRMSPVTTYGNIVACCEIFAGMFWIAVTAGIVFARFSRPRSRLAFARNLVVGPGDDGPALSARVVNRRLNSLYDVEARMMLVSHQGNRRDKTPRAQELLLVQDHSPVERMTWRLVHRIDASSPLAGLDAAALIERDAQIFVNVSATEDTTLARVQAAHVFYPADILFGHAFVNLLAADATGRRWFDFSRIDQVEPLDEATAAPDRPGE